MKIHTIGDSHSFNGWEKDIVKHHIGPVLCYSFGKEKLSRCDISAFNIQDGDTVVFCFGEIDCRCHVGKHVSSTNTYTDIIDKLVFNYFEAIELNILKLRKKLKNICVYNIVPPIEKHNTLENPDYPYLGTDEERKQYTLYFNQCLKSKCIEKGYMFFDIYNKYTNSNGFLQKELSDGNVHISNGIYIKEFIDNNLL